MGWITLRKNALAAGELVYSFNQGRAAHEKFSSALAEGVDYQKGYCLGLALQWCVLRLKGSDFAADAGTRILSPEQTYRASADHATYHKAFDSTSASLRGVFMLDGTEINTVARNVALLPYGLKLWDEPRIHLGQADGGFMIGSGEQRGGLAMIGWLGEDSAHATAVQFRGPAEPVNYFDANYGHFVFGTARRFVQWFGSYLHESEYGRDYAKQQSQHMLGLA